MKISYNWLKKYVPDLPKEDKMWDIFTYHLCEVENVEKLPNGDTIFDINILPNRAHDLLSHFGVARELSFLLILSLKESFEEYKIPKSNKTNLTIKIKTENCRRYMGRIIRNVKIEESPQWLKDALESIGQKSINNIVDATNYVMYDLGQPTHCFDLDKLVGGIVVREAKEGEQVELLGADFLNKKERPVALNSSNMIISDEDDNVLALAGVKGGKYAEVDKNTKNILIEVANFEPVSVRKTKGMYGLFTDSAKRFENDLSPELVDFAMQELSSIFSEYHFNDFEDVIDVYPRKQEQKNLIFSLSKISKILGVEIKESELINILNSYQFSYIQNGNIFEIKVPYYRLDLNIEEDMAEEIGRVLGYRELVPNLPKISFTPKINETYQKVLFARNYLLSSGYSEVMTYTFCDKGEVEVLASASDKKFLRTNLKDGLSESIKMNILNAPLLKQNEIKIFEIGKVFFKDKEELKVGFGDKKKIEEMLLEDFVKKIPHNFVFEKTEKNTNKTFKGWSIYPFIVRDIALWVPESILGENVENIIKENINQLVVKGPTLFDEFKKDGRVSYAFRLVFQSYEKTLTDEEVNIVMQKITEKLKENSDWEIR